MTRIKKFFYYCVALYFCLAITTSVSLAALPDNIDISSVVYDSDERSVTIDGVAREGLKAVIWEVWHVDCGSERNGQMKFFGSIMVNNEEFHSSIKVAEMKDGRYLIKVANYFGGNYATAEFGVPFLSPTTIPADKPVCNPILKDKLPSADVTILRTSRDTHLFSLIPIPALTITPNFLTKLILSIFTNASR